jgi:hypothetical protein
MASVSVSPGVIPVVAPLGPQPNCTGVSSGAGDSTVTSHTVTQQSHTTATDDIQASAMLPHTLTQHAALQCQHHPHLVPRVEIHAIQPRATTINTTNAVVQPCSNMLVCVWHIMVMMLGLGRHGMQARDTWLLLHAFRCRLWSVC